MAEQLGYDTIGISYGRFRRSGPRIARRLYRALGGAVSVVNVGAGHGSYEPTDRDVIAVEPSLIMIRQRPQNAAPVVQAVAESLPFADATFGAAMALFTVHHWHDAHRGLAELQCVTYGPIVVFAFDPAVRDDRWLVTEYLPTLADLHAHYPTSHEIAEALGDARVEAVGDRDIACAERQTIDEPRHLSEPRATSSGCDRAIESRDLVVPFWCRDALTRGVREPIARHHALQRRRSEHMQRSR